MDIILVLLLCGCLSILVCLGALAVNLFTHDRFENVCEPIMFGSSILFLTFIAVALVIMIVSGMI